MIAALGRERIMSTRGPIVRRTRAERPRAIPSGSPIAAATTTPVIVIVTVVAMEFQVAGSDNSCERLARTQKGDETNLVFGLSVAERYEEAAAQLPIQSRI